MDRQEAAAAQPDLHLRPSPNHCNSPHLTPADTTPLAGGAAIAPAPAAAAAAAQAPALSKVCKVDEGYSDDTRSSSDQDLSSSSNDVMALSDWMLAQSEHDRAGMWDLAFCYVIFLFSLRSRTSLTNCPIIPLNRSGLQSVTIPSHFHCRDGRRTPYPSIAYGSGS